MDEESDIDILLTPVSLDKRHQFVDRRVTEAEAFNDLIERHLPPGIKDWECDLSGWRFDLACATAMINNDSNGPITVKVSSGIIPRKFLDGMRMALRKIVHSSCELQWNTTEFATILLQLSEEAVSWVDIWKEHESQLALRNRGKRGITLKVSDLQLEAESEDSDEEGLDPAELRRLMARKNATPQEAFKAQDVCGWYSIMDNSTGLDLSSVDDTTKHLLGKSITEICREITHPRHYGDMLYGGQVHNDDIRILHVEPVYRHDLVNRFLKRRVEIHQDLLQMRYRDLRKSVDRKTIRPNSRDDTDEGLARALAQTSVTFHGAPRHVIESIVRYGFVVPGQSIGDTEKVLDIAHGATFGVGIYSSPDPYFAMDYAGHTYGTTGSERSGVLKARDIPGTRLIVCGTLMGRAATVTRDETWRTTDLLLGSTHSHVSACQKQYTVFDSAQILPCYVLHLDDHPDLRNAGLMSHYGTGISRLSAAKLSALTWTEDPEPRDPKHPDFVYPAEVERKKRALKAAATKWFPYGFGPATGANFVIEEVADVSDDEEVYGEFQHQRIEQEHEIREQYTAPGASWLDQYQTVRKTKIDVYS